ncbi:ATP-binding cassette domain-containing protein [Nocardia sp. NPDC003963]
MPSSNEAGTVTGENAPPIRAANSRPPGGDVPESGTAHTQPAPARTHTNGSGPAATASRDAVRVEEITKSFGDVHALRGVSFSAARGSVLGILGPNGAGKTTSVKILSTLLRPDSGTAVVAGHDVRKDPAGVRRSIMMTGQYAALDENLSGRENLELFGRLMGLGKSAARKRADALLAEFDLVDSGRRPVRQYSGGMRRRVDIACGLVVRPEVVFLDEPTTGLDPRSRQGVWDLVSALKEQGITVLLTTQYLEEADVLSDNIIVIDRGTVIAEGTADELKEKTGGSYCEIVPLDPTHLDRAATALGDLVPPALRRDLGGAERLSIPAPDGAATLAEALRRLDTADIALADIGLRRPSLDDVFLSITGHPGRSEQPGSPS